MPGMIVTIASGIGALIVIYLLVAHPQGVVAIAGTTGNFVVNESKTLQGR